MIVSWNWLRDYVLLDMDAAELEHRLSMAGLNHESTSRVADDLAIDLEVTSNRPDCLGHIGVAREIAVLWDRELKVPDPVLPAGGPAIGDLVKVSIECPELCSRYTARLIQGVKIGPSPQWLADRLRTLGIAVINNVVDVTNYVMMECGQPLHAFDLALLRGPEIIVRRAQPNEQFEAIDHRIYSLDTGVCVIADAQRAMALGGVMGGVDSEVADSTTDLLIESAEFDPMSIRTTARKLNLHSPSSYRFERTVDPKGIDWASRRCCQLILELAGGQVAEGVLDVGTSHSIRGPVVLRLNQLLRILGIEVDGQEVGRILTALGTRLVRGDSDSIEVIPPSWRRDLTREIDLVEEVARIHGYDKIPEDVQVPMAPSHRLETDQVQQRVRQLLTTAGYDEAITASVVPLGWAKAFSPWNQNTPLQTSTPMLKGADTLRKSLVPSILEVRRANESVANPVIELFEMANVYLPDEGELPHEQWTLSITSGSDFHGIKGVIEGLLQTVFATQSLAIRPSQISLLDADRQCELMLGNQVLGYLGDVSAKGLKQFGLRRPTSVAELNLDVLAAAADLIRQHRSLSDYPAISRDLNLIVDEPLRWLDLETTVRQAAGPLLENLQFQEVYRDRKKDGPGKKRLFFSISLRSAERTLTNEEADLVRQTVVDACAQQHQAVLLG